MRFKTENVIFGQLPLLESRKYFFFGGIFRCKLHINSESIFFFIKRIKEKICLLLQWLKFR
jgi:hypothetical protein